MKKNWVIWIFLLFAVLAGVGYYRGWFTVNQGKMQEDAEAARGKVRDLEQKAKTTVGNLADKVKD